MTPRIYPNWEQLNNLKTSLTDGESTLAKFLDDNLPPDWEIYVQPYFNGDRPDIVLLNPNIGMMIFEIKDWNLDLYRSEKEEKFDEQTKKKIEWYQSYVKDTHGKEQKIPNPIKQIERYRNNLFLYLPELAGAIDTNNNRLAALQIGIYFHKAPTNQAKTFIPNHEKKHCLVFGFDDLDSNNLKKIVPDFDRGRSAFMNNLWAENIRFWLKPPYHSIEQGQPIVLSDEQKRHIQSSPKQHQRLRGVAGSGKTLVIAQRAANLASINKKILVVTFNITLWHHIRDCISRAKYNFSWEQFEFNHFHGFCKNYLYENDISLPDMDTDTDDFLDIQIPELIIKSLKNGKNKKKREYDAILIDEGQDYCNKYYEMLCMFLSENNEVLLVADEKQNIYSRELSWLENMQGTQFKGRWRELKQSYRLPSSILKEANRFAATFLPNVGLMPEPIQGELFNPHFLWRNLDTYFLPLDKLYQAFDWLTKKKSINPSDIVILLPTHKEGIEAKQYFENKNIKINDVFEEEKGKKSHKHGFWMGDSRLKMCTIHSFKGWELNNIIVVTPNSEDYPNIDYLMYIAITRTRENLIIFNRTKKYSEYGLNWENKW